MKWMPTSMASTLEGGRLAAWRLSTARPSGRTTNAGSRATFLYQRYGHPSGAEAEAALGALEGGDALLFASGTSAVTACAFALLEPGSTVAVAEGAYFGTTVTLDELAPVGAERRRSSTRPARRRRTPTWSGSRARRTRC